MIDKNYQKIKIDFIEKNENDIYFEKDKVIYELISLSRDIRIEFGLDRRKRDLVVAGDFPVQHNQNFKDRFVVRTHLYNLLENDEVRTITLVGRGGIGKSSLIVQIVSEIERDLLPIPSNLEPLRGIAVLSKKRTNINVPKIFHSLGDLFQGKVSENIASVGLS